MSLQQRVSGICVHTLNITSTHVLGIFQEPAEVVCIGNKLLTTYQQCVRIRTRLIANRKTHAFPSNVIKQRRQHRSQTVFV